MNGIERFYKTLNREEVDYPASWLGIPVPSAHKQLKEYFEIDDVNDITEKLNLDIYAIEMPYNSPSAKEIYNALDFSKNFKANVEERTLTEEGFFADYTDPNKVEDFNWPDPKKYVVPEECLKVVESAPEGKAVLGVLWSSHFQDACAAFGMETAFMKMILEPEMFKVVIDRIADFYLEANEIFYEATKGKVHAVLIGNDLGSQQGLMISPRDVRKYVLPGTIKLIEQAKKYGAKVIYHSCGAIRDIIPDLIEVGVDVIHPIQALAEGMEPEGLKRDFGNDISFCGGVDAQNLLINGTPEEVAEKVKELKGIFPTGLILSPSHEAILTDVPPANIESLFKAVKG